MTAANWPSSAKRSTKNQKAEKTTTSSRLHLFRITRNAWFLPSPIAPSLFSSSLSLTHRAQLPNPFACSNSAYAERRPVFDDGLLRPVFDEGLLWNDHPLLDGDGTVLNAFHTVVTANHSILIEVQAPI